MQEEVGDVLLDGNGDRLPEVETVIGEFQAVTGGAQAVRCGDHKPDWALFPEITPQGSDKVADPQRGEGEDGVIGSGLVEVGQAQQGVSKEAKQEVMAFFEQAYKDLGQLGYEEAEDLVHKATAIFVGKIAAQRQCEGSSNNASGPAGLINIEIGTNIGSKGAVEVELHETQAGLEITQASYTGNSMAVREMDQQKNNKIVGDESVGSSSKEAVVTNQEGGLVDSNKEKMAPPSKPASKKVRNDRCEENRTQKSDQNGDKEKDRILMSDQEDPLASKSKEAKEIEEGNCVTPITEKNETLDRMGENINEETIQAGKKEVTFEVTVDEKLEKRNVLKPPMERDFVVTNTGNVATRKLNPETRKNMQNVEGKGEIPKAAENTLGRLDEERRSNKANFDPRDSENSEEDGDDSDYSGNEGDISEESEESDGKSDYMPQTSGTISVFKANPSLNPNIPIPPPLFKSDPSIVPHTLNPKSLLYLTAASRRKRPDLAAIIDPQTPASHGHADPQTPATAARSHRSATIRFAQPHGHASPHPSRTRTATAIRSLRRPFATARPL
nr:hypothetical protein Itr_chr15CG13740 [Ipomoea trifida]